MSNQLEQRNQIKIQFPEATPEQIESLISYIYFGWEIVGQGSDNSIDIINVKNPVGEIEAYIRADGIFRYS